MLNVRNLDITYVVHPAAVPVAERAEPGARVAMGALPVKDVFTPAGQAEARVWLALDPRRFAVLPCTGSLAFGQVGRTVPALLAAGPNVRLIAVCGRNGHLRGRLAARGEPAARQQATTMSALSGVLLADPGGVYDPGFYNDRLLLGLKGAVSEAEL